VAMRSGPRGERTFGVLVGRFGDVDAATQVQARLVSEEGYQQVKVVRQEPRKGAIYVGGEGAFLGEGAHGLLEALDVKTGEIRWHYRSKYPMPASVLTTAGGLVFTGDQEGNALAFDASNGELLWTFNTGSGHRGSPITYAVGGKQYIAVPSGRGGFLAWHQPAFPELADATRGSTLFVFGLFEE